MSYRRVGMGDPVTSPSQVDEHNDSIIVGDVAPTRLACWQLPPDSPYKQPGASCDPAKDAPSTWLVDGIRSAVDSVTSLLSPSPAAVATDSGIPTALIVGGLATAAYFMFRKKKRT